MSEEAVTNGVTVEAVSGNKGLDNGVIWTETLKVNMNVDTD